jgi:hypothetical protein
MRQLTELDLSHNSLGIKVLKRAKKVKAHFDNSLLINLHCCPPLYKPISDEQFNQDERIKLSNVTSDFLLSISETPYLKVMLPKLDLSYQPCLSDPIFT